MSQLSSAYAAGSSAVNGLCVVYGIRARYVGTSDNIAGELFFYSDPDHNNVSVDPTSSQTATYADLMSRTGTSRIVVSKEWSTWSIYPVVGKENGPQGNALATCIYPFSGGEDNITGYTDSYNGVNAGCPVAILMASGPSQTVIQVEMIMHAEFFGPSVAWGMTSVTADPEGALEVVNAAQRMRRSTKTFSWGAMKGALTTVGKTIVKHALPVAVAAVVAM